MSVLTDLVNQIDDIALRERIQKEVNKLAKQKKFGLVFEEHMPECTPLYDMPIRAGTTVAKRAGSVNDIYRVLRINNGVATCIHKESQDICTIDVAELVAIAEFGESIYPYLKPIDSVCNAPDSGLWHTLIEADNYHALQLLEYLYAGKVDCIYIDPPYNTGAKDWKYNNDYVDGSDTYRHSKWLSFMEKRLRLAKKLLNPEDSVLIVTIDEKEYLHLGCLLEEVFPDARMQMITSVISAKGIVRAGQFSRVEEYIYILEYGTSAATPGIYNMLDGEIKKESDREIEWLGFRRRAPQAKRESRPNQFYPIFVNNSDGTIHSIGDVVKAGIDRNTIPIPNGCTALWPLSKDGDERLWSLVPDQARINHHKGYLRINNWDSETKTGTVYYLASGTIDDIENHKATVLGYNQDGSVIAKYCAEGTTPPKRVWNMKSHNAETFGTNILNAIIGKRFEYPKSLYAVKDILGFYIANKPNALVIDFFAGSGTTLHALNLINAEDEGNRRCIMVTNNEVYEAEAESLKKQGYTPGDFEWEQRGIAQYVTWPRTVGSITGKNLSNEPLSGDYGIFEEEYVLDEDCAIISKSTGKPVKKSVYVKKKVQKAPALAEIKKANGFKANAVFFKLSFLDKTAVALGMTFKEMLPTLWMKAGAIGKCPTVEGLTIPTMMILPKNKFAVLLNENSFAPFAEELDKHPEIQTVFLATDYDINYRSMVKNLNVQNTYQLYRDYLDHFRLNRGRS